MTPPSRAISSRAIALALVLCGSCRGGCGGAERSPPRDPVLSSLPDQTRLVVSVDLAKIRDTALWSKLAALAEESPEDKERLQRLAARTGLDPLRQIQRIVAAFPEDARARGQFAVMIEGRDFDEPRLVAFAREEGGPGSKLVAHPRGRRVLYAGAGPDRTAGFFVGSSRLMVGAGGWAEAMADLADGEPQLRSAADNLELTGLIGRIDPRRAVWFAGLVPAELRKSLMADPALASVGSIARVAASAELGPGLTAELVAEMSNADDARDRVAHLQATVREAKRDAKVLMLGLGPYLDALQARAEGPFMRVTLVLPQAQLQDLLERLTGLARLARPARPPAGDAGRPVD